MSNMVKYKIIEPKKNPLTQNKTPNTDRRLESSESFEFQEPAEEKSVSNKQTLNPLNRLSDEFYPQAPNNSIDYASESSRMRYLISQNEKENIDFISTLIRLKGRNKKSQSDKMIQNFPAINDDIKNIQLNNIPNNFPDDESKSYIKEILDICNTKNEYSEVNNNYNNYFNSNIVADDVSNTERKFNHINYNNVNNFKKINEMSLMTINSSSKQRGHHAIKPKQLQQQQQQQPLEIMPIRKKKNIDSLTSVDPYLRRRHMEELARMDKIKKDKDKKDICDKMFTPQINKRSKVICNKINNMKYQGIETKVPDRKTNSKTPVYLVSEVRNGFFDNENFLLDEEVNMLMQEARDIENNKAFKRYFELSKKKDKVKGGENYTNSKSVRGNVSNNNNMNSKNSLSGSINVSSSVRGYKKKIDISNEEMYEGYNRNYNEDKVEGDYKEDDSYKGVPIGERLFYSTEDVENERETLQNRQINEIEGMKLNIKEIKKETEEREKLLKKYQSVDISEIKEGLYYHKDMLNEDGNGNNLYDVVNEKNAGSLNLNENDRVTKKRRNELRETNYNKDKYSNNNKTTGGNYSVDFCKANNFGDYGSNVSTSDNQINNNGNTNSNNNISSGVPLKKLNTNKDNDKDKEKEKTNSSDVVLSQENPNNNNNIQPKIEKNEQHKKKSNKVATAEINLFDEDDEEEPTDTNNPNTNILNIDNDPKSISEYSKKQTSPNDSLNISSSKSTKNQKNSILATIVSSVEPIKEDKIEFDIDDLLTPKYMFNQSPNFTDNPQTINFELRRHLSKSFCAIQQESEKKKEKSLVKSKVSHTKTPSASHVKPVNTSKVSIRRVRRNTQKISNIPNQKKEKKFGFYPRKNKRENSQKIQKINKENGNNANFDNYFKNILLNDNNNNNNNKKKIEEMLEQSENIAQSIIKKKESKGSEGNGKDCEKEEEKNLIKRSYRNEEKGIEGEGSFEKIKGNVNRTGVKMDQEEKDDKEFNSE